MNKKSIDIDWADIVDTFASEYGWTIDYIVSLDLGQVISLRNQIQKRYEAQNSGSSPESTGVSTTEQINTEEAFVEYLQKNAGAKKRVRKDGKTEIVL